MGFGLNAQLYSAVSLLIFESKLASLKLSDLLDVFPKGGNGPEIIIIVRHATRSRLTTAVSLHDAKPKPALFFLCGSLPGLSQSAMTFFPSGAQVNAFSRCWLASILRM